MEAEIYAWYCGFNALGSAFKWERDNAKMKRMTRKKNGDNCRLNHE